MRLVAVEWIDSHIGNDWKTVEEARAEAAEKSSLLMRSVGYLVVEEDGYLLLAGSWSPGSSAGDDLVNGLMQIPRSAVTVVRSLVSNG